MSNDNEPKNEKKDLTSLTDLSQLHLTSEEEPQSEEPPFSPPASEVLENDFKSLEELDSLDLSGEEEVAPSRVKEESPTDAEISYHTSSLDLSALESQSDQNNLPDSPDFASETPAEPLPSSPLHAAPAASGHVKNEIENTNLSSEESIQEVRSFANQIPIGSPQIEANPAFSFFATGNFTPEILQAIENALGNESYGVRFEDLKIQLEQNKLFVPRISEFAAISLAQKLFDKLEHIEIDLAENIYKKSSLQTENASSDDVIRFLSTEAFSGPSEEIHDVAAEPNAEKDLFSSNLHEIENHHITRILSTLNVSQIIDAHIAENTNSPEFEDILEKITHNLKQKAFKLGAHGVVGVSFSLKPIDAHRNDAGDIMRAYRLFGTGTAVRVRKKI